MNNLLQFISYLPFVVTKLPLNVIYCHSRKRLIFSSLQIVYLLLLRSYQNSRWVFWIPSSQNKFSGVLYSQTLMVSKGGGAGGTDSKRSWFGWLTILNLALHFSIVKREGEVFVWEPNWFRLVILIK